MSLPWVAHGRSGQLIRSGAHCGRCRARYWASSVTEEAPPRWPCSRRLASFCETVVPPLSTVQRAPLLLSHWCNRNPLLCIHERHAGYRGGRSVRLVKTDRRLPVSADIERTHDSLAFLCDWRLPTSAEAC